ncbi:hypothetical protein BIFGAL_04061 [Bifidobacterium gallicum DSM 20093 = LMG 11596]|uniref:Uncharacterized protein n=1 Tax=Bifidobacterium gallicum DSM 20093 = LMG 11596 TaxID=561180 RepID=D1NW16_9BIFI|nr:hypothetical protein BIFGAL_04061 [Bifidobacterium gallicum DSM 20093 = LMG 11596]
MGLWWGLQGSVGCGGSADWGELASFLTSLARRVAIFGLELQFC